MTDVVEQLREAVTVLDKPLHRNAVADVLLSGTKDDKPRN
jgi:hypothetical protein